MTEKLVSVIIPFYNRIPWCMEAIESVQKQTYSNWEIILINDGSEDDIEEIRAAARADARIHLIEQENRGAAAARNTGIAAANGFYIALLDSDDLWDPQKLEKQISYMEAHGYRVTHTNYTLFDENGTIREVNTGALEGDVLKKLIVSCPLCTPSAVVEKALIDNLHPPFEERFHYGEDGCFWISLAAQTKVGAIREPLTLVRHTEATADDIKKVRIACTNVLSFVLGDPYLSSFSQEIHQLSKSIEGISGEIERRQKIVRSMEEVQKSLLPIRDKIAKEFEMAGFYPKVSIIIPVYNGANYMREAIDSALSQTYGNIEVIVVNDGSCDNGETARIARSYGDLIRYFEKPNGGVATALNLGIEKMTGEYFSWLSHDDVYEPKKIEEQIRLLCKQADRQCIIFSGYRTINEAGESLHECFFPPDICENLLSLLSIETELSLNGCTLLIPTEVLRTNRFDEMLRYTQDYDMWLKLYEKVPFVYIDKCLVLSRQHSQQDSRSGGKKVLEEADRFRFRSISNLSPEEALRYVGNSMDKLRTFTDNYIANGYEASYIALSILIRKCQEVKLGQTYAQSLKHWLGITNKPGEFEQEIVRTDSQKPVLVLYSNVWTFGGIERVLSSLIPRFCKSYHVVLLSNYVRGERGYHLPDGVTHLTIQQEHQMPIHQRISAVCKIVNATIFIGNPNVVVEFLPVYGLLSRMEIKTVALNHYYYYLPYHLSWLAPVSELRHKAFERADAVVWVSKFSSMVCSQRCDHVAYIPNPNTFEVVPPRNQPSGHVVLAVGRFFDSLKRIDRIIEIFGHLRKKMPDATLMLLGKCPDLKEHIPEPVNNSIQNALDAAGLAHSDVIFAGEQDDVRSYYEQASVLLFASECEGFGMVLTEAGEYGIPAVVYGTPGLESIIIDGENGYVIENGRVDLAVECIYELLQNQNLWLEMSRSARRLAERFSIDNVYARWETLFQILLETDEMPIGERLYRAGLNDNDSAPLSVLYDVIAEYERLLKGKSAVTQQIMTVSVPSFELQWQAECERMQQSFSWRITRPLRLIKKSIIVLKAEGLGALLKKIRRKLFVR